jgi:integrase/recombinase XerD
MLIHIQKGKGNKDRYVMLSPRLLAVLRRYWRAARPDKWMFPSWGGKRHLSPNSLSQACRDAARQSGLGKRITANMLRHYAASRTMPQVDVATAVHGPPSGGCAAYFASLPGTLGK